MVKWNFFTCMIISWQTSWFWAQMTIIQLNHMKLEKSPPDCFQDYLNATRFSLFLFCQSMHFFGFVVFFCCCFSTVVSSYCDASFHSISVMSSWYVMKKLSKIAWHSPFNRGWTVANIGQKIRARVRFFSLVWCCRHALDSVSSDFNI